MDKLYIQGGCGLSGVCDDSAGRRPLLLDLFSGAGGAADADEVARVHVRSWQSAYRGLIAQDYLDGLALEAMARRYNFGRVGLQLPSTFVAVDGSTICGLAATGLCRDMALPSFGELMAIYVDPPDLRTGVGRALMTAARGRLRHVGVAGAVLWVWTATSAPGCSMNAMGGGSTGHAAQRISATFR